jgi:hypothetical protein
MVDPTMVVVERALSVQSPTSSILVSEFPSLDEYHFVFEFAPWTLQSAVVGSAPWILQLTVVNSAP